MAEWAIAIHLAENDAPLFRRIADSIRDDIEGQRLHPGQRLPSSRRLAKQLGVNRNTVIAAYDELRAHTWICSEPTRGTFVARRKNTSVSSSSSALGFDLGDEIVGDIPIARTPNTLLLLGGVPDMRLLPQKELARAYRSVLVGRRGQRLLDYGTPVGNPRLRRALADLLARRRGLSVPLDSIATVRGSQQGMFVAAKSLIAPGDVVAIEALGYRNAWQALRLAGAQLRPIPIDGQGLNVDALEDLCRSEPVRAVMVTPHHQYPTGVALSGPRRTRLLELARRQRMIIFEDDYDFDFHYDSEPVFPLAAEDTAGVVVYFGTLSKCLAPGLRLGFVVAPPAVIERLAAYRTYVDCQGDHGLEEAVAVLLEEGVVQLHVERARREYETRRDVLCAALHRSIPELRFEIPHGGMAVWAEAEGIDVDAWVARALKAGAAFQALSRFAFDETTVSSSFARIGFAACNRRELAEGVRILKATLRAPES